MKKKFLLTSILTLVMCCSLICGATFALFTSESKVNISVTSGSVSVNAVIEDVEYKTLTKDWTAANVNETIIFDDLNGSATIVGKDVELVKIVPGDGIKFNISVENLSDVKVKYRAVIENTDIDATFFNALEIKINGNDYNGKASTPWTVLAPNNDVEDLVSVSIVLPDDVDGPEYMGKTCKFVVLVEAIQANAETFETVSTVEELQAALAQGSNVALNNDITVSSTITCEKDTVINLNGKEIISQINNSALYVSESKLTLKDTVGGGKITTSKSYAVQLGNNAELVVDGVDLLSSKQQAIDVASIVYLPNDPNGFGEPTGMIITINSGTVHGVYLRSDAQLTVNGGVVENISSHTKSAIVSSSPTSVITINGGQVINNNNSYQAIQTKGTLNIEGGQIIARNTTVATNLITLSGDTAVVNVNGGELILDFTSNVYYNRFVFSKLGGGTVNINGGKVQYVKDRLCDTGITVNINDQSALYEVSFS